MKLQAPADGVAGVDGRPRREAFTFVLVAESTPKLSKRLRMEVICDSVRAALATSGTAKEAPETKRAVERLKKETATLVATAFLNLVLIITFFVL